MIQILETTIVAKMSKHEAACLVRVLEFYRDSNGHMWLDIGKDGTVANFVAETLKALEGKL